MTPSGFEAADMWTWMSGLSGVNWQLLYHSFPRLMVGAGYTVCITFAALIIGTALGLTLAIMRLARRRIWRWPSLAYIEVFRDTPMLVQIFLFYFALFPKFQDILDLAGIEWLQGVNLRRAPAIYAGILTLGLNSAAYLAEIFRGGILSIDRGQNEAALSLGMSDYQSMRYVILPQAFTNSLPALGNEFITLTKDSSLVAMIAVPELLYRAMQIASNNYEYFTMYVGIAMVYFAMCFGASRLLAALEGRMRIGQR